MRHHLYEHAIPTISSEESEFVKLIQYLELASESSITSHFDSATALNWFNDEVSVTVPLLWCQQFGVLTSKREIAARNLIIDQHVSWQMPKLLRLPREYEKIFSVHKLNFENFFFS